MALFSLNSWSFLDFLLALFDFAPGSQNNVSRVQIGHEFLPIVCCFCFIIESLQSFLIHCFLDVLEHDWELMGKSFPFDLWFFTIESDNCFNFLILDVFGSNLKSDWDTL